MISQSCLPAHVSEVRKQHIEHFHTVEDIQMGHKQTIETILGADEDPSYSERPLYHVSLSSSEAQSHSKASPLFEAKYVDCI
jgi:hypothetical protein